MKKFIKKLIIILLIGLILVSSYFIFMELMENKEQQEAFDELVEIVEETNDSESDIDLKSLYELNNDLIGWVRIENTSIDYPVMQTVDNPNYYLKKDFYKNYSRWGTPYLAEQCNVNTSDHLIIYGHHVNGVNMFGYLENYKSQEFYEENKIINFYTFNGDETEKSEYEIFAVYKTVVYSSKGFKYYKYTNFDSVEEYEEFVNKCKSLALYETNVIPEYDEQLLTLSTCEYSNKNGRLVVIARKIEK